MIDIYNKSADSYFGNDLDIFLTESFSINGLLQTIIQKAKEIVNSIFSTIFKFIINRIKNFASFVLKMEIKTFLQILVERNPNRYVIAADIDSYVIHMINFVKLFKRKVNEIIKTPINNLNVINMNNFSFIESPQNQILNDKEANKRMTIREYQKKILSHIQALISAKSNYIGDYFRTSEDIERYFNRCISTITNDKNLTNQDVEITQKNIETIRNIVYESSNWFNTAVSDYREYILCSLKALLLLSPSDVQYLPFVSDFYKDFKKDAKFLLDSQNNIYLKWDKVLSPKFSMLKWEEAFDRRSDKITTEI